MPAVCSAESGAVDVTSDGLDPDGIDSRGAVAVVTLCNPAVRNALTMQMWRDLLRVVEELDADPSIRAVVVHGYGLDFSSGAHIGDLPEDPQEFHRLHLAAEAAIAESSTPFIAAIAGDCIGGGCEIAVACDVRIAEASARFGITASRLGIVYPEVPTRRLRELVGVAETRRMLIIGELFDVTWARTAGLVGEVVGSGEALSRALDLARLIARRSPVTIAGVQAATRDRPVQVADEATHYREGRVAFLEGRQPLFPAIDRSTHDSARDEDRS